MHAPKLPVRNSHFSIALINHQAVCNAHAAATLCIAATSFFGQLVLRHKCTIGPVAHHAAVAVAV
jgi:hypothetical protein